MGDDRRVPVLTETSRKTGLAFGEVSIDLERRRVQAPAGVRHLEPRAFDVLLTLTERPGLTVSRDHLLETVWDDGEGSGAALNVAVSQLREALDDDVLAPRYIETVPWLGYRWIYQDPPAPSGSLWRLGPVLEAAGAMLAIAVGGNVRLQNERAKRVAPEPRSFADR